MIELKDVAAIRAGCSVGDFGIHQPCRYPDCACEEVPNGIRAALAKAALADLYAALDNLVTIISSGNGDPMSGAASVATIRKFAKLVKANDAGIAALAKARGDA